MFLFSKLTFKSFSFLLLLIAVTPFTYAYLGTSDGGGGVGVRCSSSQSRVRLELLDLHEAKLRGEMIFHNPSSEREAIHLSASKLGNHYYIPSRLSPAAYIEYLKRSLVEKIFKGLPFQNPKSGRRTTIQFVDDLPLSSDIGEYTIAPGCSLEQVAYYFDDIDVLKIVTSRWNELNWVDRSALVSHEIQYYLDRFEGIEDFGRPNQDKTSERTRRLVGMLYSNHGVKPKYQSVTRAEKLICAENTSNPQRKTWFYAFPSGDTAFTGVFMSTSGYSSAYEMKALFTDSDINQLTDWFDGEMSSVAELYIDSPEELPAFFVKVEKQKN